MELLMCDVEQLCVADHTCRVCCRDPSRMLRIAKVFGDCGCKQVLVRSIGVTLRIEG